jgi:hypothetical protein
MTNKIVKFFNNDDYTPGKGTIFGVLAVSIILLYVVNNLRYMGITQLSDSFISCLWAINIVFGVLIIGYFAFLLFKPAWFYHLIQLLVDASAALALYIVYRQFPFALASSTATTITRVIIVLMIAVFAVSFIIETYRFFRSPKRQPKAAWQPEIPQTFPVVSPEPPADISRTAGIQDSQSETDEDKPDNQSDTADRNRQSPGGDTEV